MRRTLAFLTLFVVVLLLLTRKERATAPYLPIPAMVRGVYPWNITRIQNPQRVSSSARGIQIRYAPGAAGLDNGAVFRAVPRGLPATSASFGYSVYFPTDFDWVKGGKLPGLCIGTAPAECSTGGNWTTSAGSFRIMFRAGGQAIGYAYFPLAGGNQGAYAVQGPEYKASADASNGNTGHDIWFKKNKSFQLIAGEWNTVRMRVALNSPGKSDGSLDLTINGVSRTIRGVRWRDSAKSMINSVNFVSFYGGSDVSWAPARPSYTLYKDITFAAR